MTNSIMCKHTSDSVVHIFVECSFNINIWSFSKDLLCCNSNWGDADLEEYFRSWFQETTSYKILPIFISKWISNMRDKAIFQFISPNVMLCRLKCISLFKYYMNLKHSKKTKVLYPPTIYWLSIVLFFDGWTLLIIHVDVVWFLFYIRNVTLIWGWVED